MLSQVEAHRLAAAINQLRPDWPLASLSTWIRTNLAERAYRDAAVALAWVAADPATTTPGRVLEAGPWWRAVVADKGTVSAVTTRCGDHPGHPALHCPECAEEVLTDPELIAARAAAVRAAIPRRQVTHRHPTPPATDVRAAREAIDTKEQQP